MLRIIERTSSALAAISLLATALGFAIVGKPLWADEPISNIACDNCAHGCPRCPTPEQIYCDDIQNNDCGCDCVQSHFVGCAVDQYYYHCVIG
jgi:hypothetical protein